MLKRLFSLSLVLCLLISALPTTAAASEMKPTFLASGENATVAGSVMAAVSTNFSTNYNTEGSFFSETSVDNKINAAVAITDSDDAEISGYRYFPESGETLAVVSPEFPEIYPSDEEPSKNLLDKNLNTIEAYTAGTTTNVIDSDGYSHPMQCLYVGTYCTVWGSTADDASIQITTDMARNIGQEFDSNYLTTVNGFGQGIDADKDGKVAIFCYDIDQDYGTTITTYTAGFFRPTDMVNSSGYIGNAYFGPNNYIGMGYDCIHIDTYPTMGYPASAALTDVEGCYSTLIHEYQHLINFSSWVNTGATGDSMETYLNEAFSMAAEHMICGATETSDRVEYFNSTRYTPGYPLTYWGGSLSNYSNSYLFGQYIRTRYAQLTGTNGNGVFKAITNEWYRYIHNTEIEAVASVLETTSQQLILDFWAAVYLKDSSGPYGFNGEAWADAISPYLYSSVAAGSTNIGNGSAKFYLLADGSYTPTTSSALAFIGFSDSGEITSPDGFSGGSGTADDPYLIATKEDLDNVRNHLDAHFKMAADIVFTEADFAEGGAFYNNGAGWQPIGDADNPFTGIFDGNGHSINGLYQNISASSDCYGGLLSYANGATIKNVGMVDNNITASTNSGYSYAGGIVGKATATTIDNCSNMGCITEGIPSTGCIGGIAGSAYTSFISNCFNEGVIRGSQSVGGIVGEGGSISDCYNIGSLIGSETGGIMGSSWGNSITNCYNKGEVNGHHSGGIVGYAVMNATISNCYSSGPIRGTRAGGIVGSLVDGSSVSNAYNEGTITGTDYSGGIAGFMTNASITTCYNIATIKGTPTDGSYLSCSGGIVGCAQTASAITDCLNIGPVKNEMSGGIAGAMYNLASISKSYNIGKLTGSVWEGGIAAFVTPGHNVGITDCYYLETIKRCVGNDNTEGVANCSTCSIAQSSSSNIGDRRQITFSIAVSGGAAGKVSGTVTVILGKAPSGSSRTLIIVKENSKEETETLKGENIASKAETANRFTDLNESAYYYDAVLWAAENGITLGTGDGTTFRPDAACTRGQMMTFLWRAAGSPEPMSLENKFSDVKEDSQYYKAILWAAENGITLGATETTFAPDAACTRAQMVTFLYRFADTPAATEGSRFTDVAEDIYYATAILWAVENGITLGTGDGTTFSPNAACTRSQIAVFLHRYFAK